jgi:acylphosphatase
MKRCLKIIISGKVQGVFYRIKTKEKAEELNLIGWVKNALNGKVEILAQGDERDLKELIEWCYNGSREARVERVEVEWKEKELERKSEFDKFEILL